ncbi:MAG: lycopene beta-cyclase CrtY [Gammaproteobacteria bacterium]|nr:lycopene beta-cyclase CrtY [Gammaproteobacteria bacterium]
MSDLLIAGGGLSGVLLALALRSRQPGVRLSVVEGGERLGGNHTWSYHSTDLDADGHALLKPFAPMHWPAQRVRFPGYERRLPVGYNSIESSRFHRVAMRVLGEHVRLDAPIEAVHGDHVQLASGERLAAGCVVDARGARPSAHLKIAFQSFVGTVLELRDAHGVREPVIMDATVPQLDGYRFVYLLPFSERRLLVEDTYYTRSSELDAALVRRRIDGYVHERGWQVDAVLREERGVLPLLLGGDIEAFWSEQRGGPVPIGLRAALFHPTTGYSLPDAVRLSHRLAAAPAEDSAAMLARVREHGLSLWRRNAMFRRLNRLLFLAASDSERRAVLERFYSLPVPLISRFYAGHLRLADKLRILVGKPPIPMARALRYLPDASA